MKKIVLFLISVYFCSNSYSATHNYVSGALENVNSWSPVPANFTNSSDVFVIGAAPSNLTASWTVAGEVQISSGFSLTQTAGLFTVGTLRVSGTFINSTASINSITSLIIETTGSMTANTRSNVTNFTLSGSATYTHNAAGSTANGASNDFPGSNTRTVSNTSTIIVQKWANGGTSITAFPLSTVGNLTIDISSLNNGWTIGLSTVNGNLIVENMDNKNLAVLSGNSTLNINGNLILNNSSSIYFNQGATATGTLNLKGDFIMTDNSKAIKSNGSVQINFAGTTQQTLHTDNSVSYFDSFNNKINYQVNAGAIVLLDINHSDRISMGSGRTFVVNGELDFNSGTTLINGSGIFTLSAGGTLNILSDNGITSSGSTGQIHSTNRTFSTSANYVYKGSSGSQVFGNGLPSTVNNLTIANTGGANFTESVSRTINGTLSITSGTYSNGAGINLNAANLLVNGGTFTTSSTSVTNVTNNLSLSSGTVNFGGTGTKTISMDINQSGGTFNLTSGNLTIINDYIISTGTASIGGTGNKTITGDVLQSGGTFNITHSSGNLSVVGDLGFSSGTIALSSAGTQNIGSLTQTGGTFTLSGGSLTVTNAYSLNGGSGNFNNSGTKTFGSLNLTAGSFNCTDGDLITTGNMVVNGSTIDINNDNLTVGGDLTMNSGTITVDNSPALSIDGDLTIDGGDVVLTSGVLLEIGGALNVNQGDLDIPVNADVTVNGDLNLTVAEGVKIRSTGINGSENGSFITKSSINMIGAGSVLAERHLTAPVSGGTFKGWYIGSPIANASSTLLTGVNDKLFDYNPNTNGWVQITHAAPQDLDPFRGYAFRLGFSGATADIDFIGEINGGEYTMEVPLSTSRFELVSNPYPSAIDWNNDAGWTRDFTTEFETTIQIPRGNSPLTFLKYNAANEGEMPIAANQGFYVKTKTGLADAPSISVNDDARLHSSQALLRPSLKTLPELNLTLNYGEVSDDLEIKFRNESHDGYDKFDSWKMFSPDEGIAEPYLYFDEEFIVAASYATLTESKSVPLGYKYTGQWTSLTWKLTSMENMEGIQVILEDKLKGEKVVLENGVSYTFESGNYNGLDRFVLHFNLSKDPNSIQENNADKVNVYSANGQLYFAGLDKNLPFEILDLSGRTIQSGMSSNNVILNSQLSNGHYLVRIQGIEKVYKIWR